MNKDTSWGKVAKWYDDLIVNDTDSYQKNVILPNLLRIIDPKQGVNILDVACGQGYFSVAFADLGANVHACDISGELIAIANKRLLNQNIKGKISFSTAPSHEMKAIESNSMDIITVILAIQNIEKLNETIEECSRILKPTGKLIIVLNHPAFRIPQQSSWQWDEKDSKQYRRIDAYMSERSTKIDMTPGEQNINKKKYTMTFHRPLQVYFKAINKCGLSISRLEEWISHRSSQKGPRASEEDRIRKEIPMFLCIEARKE